MIISGQRDVGKTTLIWSLEKKLNWPMFSVSQYLRDFHKVEGLQRKSQTELAKYDLILGQDIDNRIAELLKSEHRVIIESRVFHFVKESWLGVLKVLLTASDEVRVNRNAFREGIDVSKSRQRLLMKEDAWMQKMANQYGFSDFFEPKYFDLVIDTSDLTKEQVVEKVLDRIKGA